MKEHLFEDLDSFVAEMKSLEIDKIAFAQTNERRAQQVTHETLEVVLLRKVELLAYRDAIIYKCVIEDVDLDETHCFLEGEGFEVSRSDRNIV